MSLCEKCYYGDKYCNLRGHGGSGEVISCTKAARLKHKTNADKIRLMSDGELAEWLCCNCTGDGYGNRAEDWINWLKQEVLE
jgi:hypothetical protein